MFFISSDDGLNVSSLTHTITLGIMIPKSKIKFYGTNSRGTKQEFYIEDMPNPLSTYAKSELMEEEFVKEAMGKYLIFRTS